MSNMLTDQARQLGFFKSLARRQQDSKEFKSILWPIIAKMRAEGMPWIAIADRLNEIGYRTRRGMLWTHITVKNMRNRDHC